jgi:Holliday junction DNA helicase RuvA
MEELELFELLLSISGIGPKGALAVLSIASVSDIKNSISRGDSSLLVKVSGIGKKTAERVVLELRDKVGNLESGVEGFESGADSAGSDEIDALMALGYSMNEAREALRKVAPEISDSGERIREALKKLG